MKKLLFVVLIGLLAGTAAFADHQGLGIGIVGGGAFNNYHHYGNVGLSLKVPGVPAFWGIYPIFYGRGFALGLTGDFYLFDNSLIEKKVTNEDGTYNFKLDWYLGVGIFGNMHFWNNNAAMSVGPRVPIGLSWHIIKPLELFFDIAPGLGAYFGPGGPYFYGTCALELGLRFWL